MKRALVAAAILGACGGHPKPVDPPAKPAAPDAGVAAADTIPEKLRTETEAAIAFVEAMATAAATAGDDCAAMAKALKPVADGPDGKAIVTLESDPDYKQYALALNEGYGDRLDTMTDHLGEAIGPCGYDPEVTPILVDTGIVQPQDEPAD